MNGRFQINIPEKYVISQPDMSGNETNPDFSVMLDKYCNNIIRRGWKVWNGGPTLHSEVQSLIVAEVELIWAYGGTVDNYSTWVKVAEADIDTEIPAGLPNRTYQVVIDDSDPDNIVTEDRVHTWRTWRSPNHPLQLVNGNYYFISSTFGKSLTDNALKLVHNSTTAILVDEIPVIE